MLVLEIIVTILILTVVSLFIGVLVVTIFDETKELIKYLKNKL